MLRFWHVWSRAGLMPAVTATRSSGIHQPCHDLPCHVWQMWFHCRCLVPMKIFLMKLLLSKWHTSEQIREDWYLLSHHPYRTVASCIGSPSRIKLIWEFKSYFYLPHSQSQRVLDFRASKVSCYMFTFAKEYFVECKTMNYPRPA